MAEKASPQTTGPLKGLRVLDLSRLLPGPLASLLMVQNGAEVLKVEDPDFPDYVRIFPPFNERGHSVHYEVLNRGKKSLSFKWSSKAGLEQIKNLLASCDVLLESYRPGFLAEKGLGYNDLKTEFPALIYVSVTGYGQSGAYSERAGHDLNYLAQSGLLGLQLNRNGELKIPGVQIADIAGGSYSVLSALGMALYQRSQNGKGQQIDVAMTDSVIPMTSLLLAQYNQEKKSPQPSKLALAGGLANYNVYQCADQRWIALGTLEPKFWARFCAAINRSDWIMRINPDPDQQNELENDLKDLFASKDMNYWAELGQKADCCLSPVLEFSELEQDEHLKNRKMLLRDGPGNPWKFSSSNVDEQISPAPALGEHNAEFLANT